MNNAPIGVEERERDDAAFDPLAEYDDPIEAENARWQSLTLEQQADGLNEAEDFMGGTSLWIVRDGEVVNEDVERRIARADERDRWRRALATTEGHSRTTRRVVRVRSFGRERRGRRAAVRRSSSRSPDREPEPPASDLEPIAAFILAELDAAVCACLRVQVAPEIAELRRITAELQEAS